MPPLVGLVYISDTYLLDLDFYLAGELILSLECCWYLLESSYYF